MTNNRIVAPDVIKGLSIILMVYGHITMVGNYEEFQKSIVGVIYTFHMPLFLIISGFFFTVNKNETAVRVKKVFQNLIKPYLIFIVVYLILMIMVNHFTHIQTNNKPPTSILEFISTVFVHPIGGYWFLHSLIVLSLLYIGINYGLPFFQYPVLFLICLIFCCLFLSDVVGLILWRTCFYFMLGFIFSNISKKKMEGNIGMLIIGLMITIYMFFTKENIKDFTVYQVVWVCGIFSLLWGGSNLLQDNFITKSVAWLGRNTLIILVLHAFFVTILKSTKNLFLHIDQSGISYAIFVTILTLVGSILMAKLFDTIKLSQYLFSKNEIYSKYNS